MRRCSLFLVPALAVLVSAGCDDPATCVPGAQVLCGCLGGRQGIQVCEGTRFGPCDCSIPDAGTDASPDGDSPADASAEDADGADGAQDASLDADSPGDAAAVDADTGSPDAGDAETPCLPLGELCAHTDTPCCEATCDGFLCCRGPGEACSRDTECCDGARYVCNDEGACEARTCLATDASEYCDFGALPCCDARLLCARRDSYPVSSCCAPDDTRLPAGESLLCCGASVPNADGTVTCGEPW